jgi:mannose-1-phosphate guanylyltransferase
MEQPTESGVDVADYALIMAGGVGSRLWPLSRRSFPKQFHSLFGDLSLLQATAKRLNGVVADENILIVTNAGYAALCRDQLPQVDPGNIIIEPASKNTAPCIALSTILLRRRDPDATTIVLPSDHVIQDEEEFKRVVRGALDLSRRSEALGTIGIQPTRPSTGYGYIEVATATEGDVTGGDVAAADVVRFTEKPDRDEARAMVASGRYLWNSGMFAWRTDVIMEALEKHAPLVYNALSGLASGARTPSWKEIESAYAACPSISIDYAVMEKAPQVFVLKGDFGWNDVGDWNAVYDLSAKDEDGNSTTGPVHSHGVRSTLIRARDRLIAAVGVEDLVIVDAGDAILVCRREDAQQVKEAANRAERD